MNNFNNVFAAIKKLCNAAGELKGKDCFERIAVETGIPLIKIEFFLKTLQDLQLIRYSIEENYVRLTQFGKRQERLFTDSSDRT